MAKNRVEVVINGNILSLQGDTSEEHMQKVAKIINEKLYEIQKAYEKNHLPASKLSQLLTLNLADEYVKKQEILEEYMGRLENSNTEKEALEKKVEALLAEVATLKEQLPKSVPSKNHTNHSNRGR